MNLPAPKGRVVNIKPCGWLWIAKSEARALSEILVRSASLKRKPSKGAVRLTKRLFCTCAEMLKK